MRLASDRLKSKQGWVGFRLGWSPCTGEGRMGRDYYLWSDQRGEGCLH